MLPEHLPRHARPAARGLARLIPSFLGRSDRSPTGMARFDFRSSSSGCRSSSTSTSSTSKSSPLYVSPQIAQLMGYSQEEWLADPDLFDQVAPPRRSRASAGRPRRAATRGNAPIDVPRLPPDRARRPRRLDPRRRDRRRGRRRPARPSAGLHAGRDGSPAGQHPARAARRDPRRSPPTRRHRTRSSPTRPQSLAGALRRRRRQLRRSGRGRRRLLRSATRPSRTGRVLERGRVVADYVERIEQGPIVIEDVSQGGLARSGVATSSSQRGVASSVDVPLFRNGVLVGVLWFNSSSPQVGTSTTCRSWSTSPGSSRSCSATREARDERRRAERDLRSRDAILAGRELVSRSAS